MRMSPSINTNMFPDTPTRPTPVQDWQLLRMFDTAEITRKDVNTLETSQEAALELDGKQTRQVMSLACSYSWAWLWLETSGDSLV